MFSNLGLNIAFRLIEKEDPKTRLTLVVTSRTLPRVREVIGQIEDHVKSLNRPGIVDYDYLLVDFTDMVSILNSYYDLNKKYDAIHYFFVNAAQGVYDGIDWVGATKQVCCNIIESVTNPTYRLQRVGVKSRDDLGLVFQANVFGPYYLIHKILPLLSAGKAKVVWISSLMSDPKFLSLNDIQMIKSDTTYEGSKRLVDLLHLATFKELNKEGVHQYLVQPGIFISHSFSVYLNLFTYYGMLWLFYIARWIGSPWHNIDGYKAANAPVYVATTRTPEHQELKYGSATDKSGSEHIKTQEVDSTGAADVLKYIKNLTAEWDDKLKNQITNTRIPI